MYGDSFTTNHISLRMIADGTIQVYRGTTTLLGTTSESFFVAAASPAYFEMKVKLHDTTGTVEIRKDGTDVLNLTSQDTKNGGTGTVFDAVKWYSHDESYMVLDDIYINNEQGTKNTGFLGPVVVETKFPNGNGNYSNFVGSDGNSIDNYLLIDEEPNHDGDTTYVESSTDTDRDSYDFEDLTITTGDVLAVRAGVVMRNTGTAENVQLSTRIVTTDYDSPTKTVPSSYDFIEHCWDVSPATAVAWTITELNAAEFGIENVA